MAIDRAVVIRLAADVRGFSSGMDSAEKSTTKLEQRVASMSRAVKAAAAESAQASERSAAAKRVEASMAEKVAAAEQRLAGVRRASGSAAEAQVAADNRLMAARDNQAIADARLAEAEGRLASMRQSGRASAAEVAGAEARAAEARRMSSAASEAVARAEARVASVRAQHGRLSEAAAVAERQLASAQELQARAATQVTSAEERAAAATRAHAAAATTSVNRTQAWNAAAGKMATVGATLGLGIALAAKQYMAFDEAMSGVRANITATPAQMTQLTAAVRQAGAASVFTATEAANAAEELAKAGVSAQDIIGGGLTGSLSLAAAGSLGLARAAEIGATAMSQFHLKGSDMSHIADVMAAGALASTASVESLSQAMAQGGGMASSMGMSLEETVGTLSLFDQNALKGSDGGTSLKTMLMSLTPTTKSASAAMEEIGLHAYDAGGQFVGITALAGQLQKGLKGMSQEQRNAALQTIFGADATRAANILYREGASGLHKYIETVSRSGVAAQVTAAKLNNAKGDLEKLKGDISDVMIGAGESANGPIRGLIQNVDGLVTAFGRLPNGVKSGMVQVTAFGAAGLLAAAGIIKTVNTIRQFATGVSSMVGHLRDGVGVFRNWATSGDSSMSMLDGLKNKARAAGNSVKNMGTMGKVGLAGLAVGLVGAGIAAATAGREIENAGRSTAQLGVDMSGAGGAGIKLNSMFKGLQVAAAADQSMTFSQAMKSLHSNMDGVDKASAGVLKSIPLIGGAFHGANGPTDAVRERLKGVGDSLAELVQSGHADQAAAKFQTIAEAARKQGVSTAELMKLMPGYSDALANTAKEQEAEAAASQKSSLEAVKAGSATKEQTQNVKNLADAYKSLNNALLQQEGGQDGALAAVDAADEALKKNGRTLAANTAEGRENRNSLRDLASKYGEWASSTLEATGSQEQANAILQEGKKQWIDHRVAMGADRAETQRMADSLFQLKDATGKPININANTAGVEAAEYTVDKLGNEIVKLKGTNITVPAETPNAPQVLQTLAAIKGSAYDASKQQVTISAKAMGDKETKAAIEAIPGAVHNKDGSVTIDAKALGTDAVKAEFSKLDHAALTLDGRVVTIPASAPNAPLVKALLEGIRGAQLNADGKTVTITSSAPMADDVRRKIQAVHGAQISTDGKTVTIDTSAPGATTARQQIIDALNAAHDKTVRITTYHIDVGGNKVADVHNGAMTGLRGGATGGAIGDLRDMKRFAAGGTFSINGTPYGYMDGRVGGKVVGPGSSTSDQVITTTSRGLVRTANDEHIIAGDEVNGFGGHAGIYRMRAMAKAGTLPRFAGGGDTSGSDWTPDMSGIMAYIASLKVDPSALTDERKKVTDQQSALNKAVRDLKAARAGVSGKTGAARVKAENAVATAIERQAKAQRDLNDHKSKLSQMEQGAKADTTTRFMMGETQQNGLTKRFLDNIDAIRARGFPRLAASLLAQGDGDAQAIAQTLSGGALARLQEAQKGLDVSDALADRKKALTDQLNGSTSGLMSATAQQQANAQVIALRAANSRQAYTGGVVKVEAPQIDYGKLAKQIRIDLPAVHVTSVMDAQVVGQSVTKWQDKESGFGSVVPGLKL